MATLVRSDRYYSLRRCLFIDCPHHRSSIIPAHIPSLSFSPSFVSTLIFNCVVFDFQDFAWKSSFCHSLCVRPSSDRGTGDHAARAEMWWDVTTATVLRRRQRSPANTEETSGCETLGGRWHSDNVREWIVSTGYFVQSDQCSTFAVYVAHEDRVDMFSLSCCYRQ